MKRFFKQHYALVAGIALPLALIAAFFLAGKAAVTGIPDPQYDAVFVAHYTGRSANEAFRLGIDDGKLTIRLRPPKDGSPRGHHAEPAVYRFDHAALYAKKIDIDFDNVVAGEVSDPELDALNENRLSPDPISPDGYKFEREGRGGGGLFAEIFGWRQRPRTPFVLKNGPRTVRVVAAEQIYTGQFLGWVEK